MKRVVFISIIQKNENPMDFWGCSNGHQQLRFANLLATTKGSLSLKRTLINTRPKEKTSRSSISLIIQADYRTGKIETTGSIFRHETEGLLPSLATTIRKSNLYTYSHKHTSIRKDFAQQHQSNKPSWLIGQEKLRPRLNFQPRDSKAGYWRPLLL